MQYLNTNTNHSVWKWRFVPIWVICLALIFFHIMPAWGTTIGFVDSFQGGESSDFKLMRGEKRIPVAVSTSLHEGDTLIVSKFGRSIILELVDSDNVTLNFNSPRPYIIKRAYPSNTIPGNLADIFSEWWGGLWENPEEEKDFARTKGEKLAMPLLEKGHNAKLLASKSELSLTWHGGIPPYSVKVQQSYAPSKNCCRWEIDGVTSTTVVLKKSDLELKVGKYYLVSITDSHGKKGNKVEESGNTVEGKFKVVAKNNLPSLSQKVKNRIKPLPDNKEKILETSWLVSCNPQWGFEAYQTVVKMPNSEAVRRFRKVLETKGPSHLKKDKCKELAK